MNNKLTNFFDDKKGVRLGDPLSHTLFNHSHYKDSLEAVIRLLFYVIILVSRPPGVQ